MLVKRTRGNQVSIPKQILKEAGITERDLYFDVAHRAGVIHLKPVTIEEKIPDRAYEALLRWVAKSRDNRRTFHNSQDAIKYLKQLTRSPRRE